MSDPLDDLLRDAVTKAKSQRLRKWLTRLLRDGEHATLDPRRRPPPDIATIRSCKGEEKVAEKT